MAYLLAYMNEMKRNVAGIGNGMECLVYAFEPFTQLAFSFSKLYFT